MTATTTLNEIEKAREQRRQRLAQADSAAWDAYAEACHAGASRDQRQGLFEAAMESLYRLRDFDREAPA